MRISDVMTREVERVRPDATLQAAAERMRAAGVGFLPVVDASGRLEGVVTDRDIVVRTVAKGLDPRRALVRDAMTAHVETCNEDQVLDEAADLMEAKAIRRLVVLDEIGRLVGVISLDDLASTPESEARVGEVLERVVDL